MMGATGFELWTAGAGLVGVQPEDAAPAEQTAEQADGQTGETGEGPEVEVVVDDDLSALEDAGTGFIGAVSDGNWTEAGDYAQTLVVAAVPVVTNIAIGIFILLVALFVAGRARSLVEKATQKANVDVTLGKFFGQVARWAILAIGLISAIGYMGVPTASFAAVIGGASLAIGLAFQGSLGNLAAGVMLLVFRPFKVGDVVQVGGVTAKVSTIDLFTTLLDTFDNRRIIMPNGNVFGSEIENITHHATRRVDIAVGTEYPADLDKVREVLEGVARDVQGGLNDPAPQVYLNELGGSSIDWAIRVWSRTEDYWAVRERLVRNTKYALDAAEIGIPFPQMDVHLDGAVVQSQG